MSFDPNWAFFPPPPNLQQQQPPPPPQAWAEQPAAQLAAATVRMPRPPHHSKAATGGGGGGFLNGAAGVSDLNPARSPRLDPFDQDTISYVLEDVRLSTLQRKLLRESSPTVSMALAVQVRPIRGHKGGQKHQLQMSSMIAYLLQSTINPNPATAKN